MHDSKIIFLLNEGVRALRVQYDPEAAKATHSVVKTLDPSIDVDDLIVVKTNTRVGMTVVKVLETDVEVDFDSNDEIKWAVQKVDTKSFDELIEQESEGIKAVQKAERRRRREQVRESLFAQHEEELKQLSIASNKEG